MLPSFKVGLLLLTMEVLDVGCNTLLKASEAKGLSKYIFTTYSHGFALVFLVPSAYLYHRKTPPPSLGIHMILRLCLLGVVCCMSASLLYIGIGYSSPTLASAMNNLTPAITFIMAIFFRMETLNLRAPSTLLKLIGTLISIAGAFIVTFYQGIPIIIFPSAKPSLNLLHGTPQGWAWGGFLIATSAIFLSLAYIIKTWIARDFNSEVLITTISFFFESSAAALIALIAERNNPSVWFPSIGIQLITVLYGAVAIAIINIVQTWACGKKGPLFVAMFKPLQMIIAVMMGVSFLKDVLHLGSVIGGTTIALGFYTVMKGKAEEENLKKDEQSSTYGSVASLDNDRVPLLQNKYMDV